MALHQVIQRLLLLGIHWEPLQPVRLSKPPRRLEPVITAIETEHRRFDERAVRFGNRYRSAFWAIYLLSALAVLCAVLPLALGWDSPSHLLHPYAGAWAVGEVIIIGTVSAIYWWGHRRDWQGEWLRARTTAELTWYLPLLTPLLDFSKPADEANWYVRAFDPGQHLRTVDDVAILCARIEPLAREQVANAWADAAFVASYAQWALDILELQRRYHHEIAARQHALLHRVHTINASLFGLTAAGGDPSPGDPYPLAVAGHDVLSRAWRIIAWSACAVGSVSSRHDLRALDQGARRRQAEYSNSGRRTSHRRQHCSAQGRDRGRPGTDPGGAPGLEFTRPTAPSAARLSRSRDMPMKLLVRLNLALGTALAIAGVVLGYACWGMLQTNAKSQVTREAALMMDSALATRTYTSIEILPLLAERMKTEFLPQTVPFYAATQNFLKLREQHPAYSYKEATLNPTNPRDRATDWESDLIQQFRNDPATHEAIGERDTPMGRSLYLARPIRAESECLTCHSAPFDRAGHLDRALWQRQRFRMAAQRNSGRPCRLGAAGGSDRERQVHFRDIVLPRCRADHTADHRERHRLLSRGATGATHGRDRQGVSMGNRSAGEFPDGGSSELAHWHSRSTGCAPASRKP